MARRPYRSRGRSSSYKRGSYRSAPRRSRSGSRRSVRRTAGTGRGQTVRLVIEQAPQGAGASLGGGMVNTGGMFGLPPSLAVTPQPAKQPVFK